MYDGRGGPAKRDAHLVYDREGFRYVGWDNHTPPRDVLRNGQEKPDVELPDRVVLPGLTDAHVHLFLDGAELNQDRRRELVQAGDAALLEAAKGRLGEIVADGVLAVRDAGDRHGVGLALSRLGRTPSRPVMPYVDSPGAAIHRRGRYGAFMSEAVEAYPTLGECVASRVEAGGDRIKIIATGIIDFEAGDVRGQPQFSTGELAEMVVAARALDRQTFAHASGKEGVGRVVEGGIDSVEHGFFVTEDQLRLMRDRDIAWVPTFAPVQAQIDHAEVFGWNDRVVSNLRRILDVHAKRLRAAYRFGVNIVAGSDAGSPGVPHGSGLISELSYMESAGLPFEAVIQSATGAATARLAFKDMFGLLTKGFRSRFLLLPEKHFQTAADLRHPEVIVRDGIAVEIIHSRN
jgi:imidazolonepropionase-like amidohydrolase